MKRLSMLVALLALTPYIRSYAQRATIAFTSEYASSVTQIAQRAIAPNGADVPIPFAPEHDHVGKLGRDVSFIVTSAPIPSGAYSSLAIDLHGSISIIRDVPASFKPGSPDRTIPSFGWLKTDVEITDAKTGTVLRREPGFVAALDSAGPGMDTSITEHLVIDLTSLEKREIVVRFIGVSMLAYNPFPTIIIDNAGSTDIQQVH